MVLDVRGAIWNPGEQISKAGAAFMPPKRNIEVRGALLGPPGAGFFLTMFAPGAGPTKKCILACGIR